MDCVSFSPMKWEGGGAQPGEVPMHLDLWKILDPVLATSGVGVEGCLGAVALSV